MYLFMNTLCAKYRCHVYTHKTDIKIQLCEEDMNPSSAKYSKAPRTKIHYTSLPKFVYVCC